MQPAPMQCMSADSARVASADAIASLPNHISHCLCMPSSPVAACARSHLSSCLAIGGRRRQHSMYSQKGVISKMADMYKSVSPSLVVSRCMHSCGSLAPRAPCKLLACKIQMGSSVASVAKKESIPLRPAACYQGPASGPGPNKRARQQSTGYSSARPALPCRVGGRGARHRRAAAGGRGGSQAHEKQRPHVGSERMRRGPILCWSAKQVRPSQPQDMPSQMLRP